MTVVAFVPLKRRSRRAPGKNLRLLAGAPLYTYCLQQLVRVPEVDSVFVFSSSRTFMREAPAGAEFIRRDSGLDSDLTSGTEIFQAFARAVCADHYLLVHATTPFLEAATMSQVVRSVIEVNEFDSALTVRRHKNYGWFAGAPLNHRLDPPLVGTQSLEAVLMEVGGAYCFSRDDILLRGRRVGDRPAFVTVSAIEGVEIDDEDDWQLADAVARGCSPRVSSK